MVCRYLVELVRVCAWPTHNQHHTQPSHPALWWPVVVLGCSTRAKFQVHHIFSIKINMGTVQQYSVGEGEVFSILDL
jgi:hypothetical protein